MATAFRSFARVLLACGLISLLDPAARADTAPGAMAAQQTLFTFRHVIIDSNGAACLRFSQTLSTDPAVHYGDYLTFSPAVPVAVAVNGTDLCLGGLDRATSYKLTIRQGLPAVSGAKLASDQKLDLTLTDRAPLVAIGGDGFILSRATTNGLEIQTVNVTKVKIHVLRMSDKLLPIEINPAAQLGNVTLNTQTMEGYDLRNLLQVAAGVAWTGTMDVPVDHNRTVTTAFPIGSVVPPGRNGVYLVVAENAATALPEGVFNGNTDSLGDNTLEQNVAAHWVVATDLALTSMRGTDGLHVFARSLATAQPITNAEIKLVSAGLDTLGDLRTGADGQAVFPAALIAGSRANSPATLLPY